MCGTFLDGYRSLVRRGIRPNSVRVKDMVRNRSRNCIFGFGGPWPCRPLDVPASGYMADRVWPIASFGQVLLRTNDL